MLDTVERNGDDHVVSWLSDEKVRRVFGGEGISCIAFWAYHLTTLLLFALAFQSFKVHDIDEFIASILPQFFQQTKYKSFQRQ